MFAWPFSTRGSRLDGAQAPPPAVPDFQQFARDDAVMKVWFPEKLSSRLDWLSAHLNMSRPDLVRSMLFEQVYGRVALLQLQDFVRKARTVSAKDRHPPSGDSILKSPERSVNLAMLGKSTDDFKLHLPARLKADVAELAHLHGLNPSNYVRKVMVQVLLGGRFHADWMQALGRLPPDLAVLEAD